MMQMSEQAAEKTAKIILLIILVVFSIIVYLNLSPAQTSQKQYHCYWMENVSGKSEWVPIEVLGRLSATKQQCYQYDSCHGGLGMSGGGCYKWAESADAKGQSWDDVAKTVRPPTSPIIPILYNH